MRTQAYERKRRTPTALRLAAWLLGGGAALFAALFLAEVALARAMHQPGLRDRIRRFNRRTLNPLTLRISGKGFRYYAALHHIGRRSGRQYTTPVDVQPFGDGFAIPLPYGADVDWCRNVLAAGGCTLEWTNHTYNLERPEIVEASVALRAFPWAERVIFAAGGIQQYLVLHAPAAAHKPVAAQG
jgi:deazaflavin-dependent oxidoreductase (nitroreductase family)